MKACHLSSLTSSGYKAFLGELWLSCAVASILRLCTDVVDSVYFLFVYDSDYATVSEDCTVDCSAAVINTFSYDSGAIKRTIILLKAESVI